jgi:hypothetical protein
MCALCVPMQALEGQEERSSAEAGALVAPLQGQLGELRGALVSLTAHLQVSCLPPGPRAWCRPGTRPSVLGVWHFLHVSSKASRMY